MRSLGNQLPIPQDKTHASRYSIMSKTHGSHPNATLEERTQSNINQHSINPSCSRKESSSSSSPRDSRPPSPRPRPRSGTRTAIAIAIAIRRRTLSFIAATRPITHTPSFGPVILWLGPIRELDFTSHATEAVVIAVGIRFVRVRVRRFVQLAQRGKTTTAFGRGFARVSHVRFLGRTREACCFAASRRWDALGAVVLGV